jgi:hypothetical protein
MRDNGCDDDGWDLFEEQTRQEFEFYACRQAYDLHRHPRDTWTYSNQATQSAWRMFHLGHVKGRTFNAT